MYHKLIHRAFNEKMPHLKRHFKGWRGRLARFILGGDAIYNLLYDTYDCGWGLGFEHGKDSARGER
jgi:hypothetical protein